MYDTTSHMGSPAHTFLGENSVVENRKFGEDWETQQKGICVDTLAHL